MRRWGTRLFVKFLDEVLRHVASLLSGQVRIVDKIARYGGEEFALIMVEIGRSEARDVVDRLRVLLAETPCILPEKNLTIEVTLSAGVATMPEDAATVEELIAAAHSGCFSMAFSAQLGERGIVPESIDTVSAVTMEGCSTTASCRSRILATGEGGFRN